MFDARRDPSRRQNFDTEQHLSSDREAPRSTATRKHEIPTDSALARQGHLRLGLVICSPRSLSEDKMQLAVDQFTCRIKVTGVGCGLRHDVEHDLAEAVEPPEAEEIGPPRWCCMKRASGDDPIGTLGVGPVPLKALPRRAQRHLRSKHCRKSQERLRLRPGPQL